MSMHDSPEVGLEALDQALDARRRRDAPFALARSFTPSELSRVGVEFGVQKG
jgi:hypothetical protein